MTTNLLTFDIEEWFHANYDGVRPDLSLGSNFRANMDVLLDLCARTGSKATFFTLGYIGEHYPDVVRKIAEQGHEVASHGYAHELAYKQTRQQFHDDVKRSIDILEQIVGHQVRGYRAPSWSIVERNLDYLEVLEELGLQYDASIFPVKTFLYGIPTAPRHIHHPIVNGRELQLYEVPMSVTRLLNRNVGYSGGFYFRFFPSWLIKQAIRKANREGSPSIVYLHPREVNPNEPQLQLPVKEHFIHYYNVGGTRHKLEDVLGSFSFTSIAEHLRQIYGVRR